MNSFYYSTPNIHDCMYILGPFQGRLVDHFGVWKMLILAASMTTIGAIITAFAPNIYVVLVSFGLVAGKQVKYLRGFN